MYSDSSIYTSDLLVNNSWCDSRNLCESLRGQGLLWKSWLYIINGCSDWHKLIDITAYRLSQIWWEETTQHSMRFIFIDIFICKGKWLCVCWTVMITRILFLWVLWVWVCTLSALLLIDVLKCCSCNILCYMSRDTWWIEWLNIIN